MRPEYVVLCPDCAETMTVAVLTVPPDESVLSRSVSERIGLAMTKAAIAEVEQLRAETGAAPRGVNSLHVVRAAWTVLVAMINEHPSATGLWRVMASYTTEYASDRVAKADQVTH